MFAGQFDHERGGRDARTDRYTVTASAGSDRLSAGGGFAAVDEADDAGGDS